MTIARGVSWEEKRRRRFASLLVSGLIAIAASAPSPAPRLPLVSVIVRALPGHQSAAREAVRREGGFPGRALPIVDGFAAVVPASQLDDVARVAVVRAVTPDARLQLFGALDDVTGTTAETLPSEPSASAQTSSVGDQSTYDPASDPTSLFSIANHVTGAADFWNRDVTGAGVDVALIDSGVAPVEGLSVPGKVHHGPDLAFEGQSETLRHLDTFGHGTHMAAIIAGRDSDVVDPSGRPDRFVGMAPDARVVSLKVADYDGATDVSQVIAAIDWVVQNRNSDGMNIRVLNLSFGTDGTQTYMLDPLAYAVEVAWHRGIVVVVAAGNHGEDRIGLTDPAFDPYVVAVGASHDADGRYGSADTSVPSWSGRGDGVRNPDLTAPGRSVGSLRVPGSFIDLNHPEGRLGDRFFRGSGTSQATAVVSGAAALILQQRPAATPDQVKALLARSASPVSTAGPRARGAGTIDLRRAVETQTPAGLAATQNHPKSVGSGSLESARGSIHVSDGETELTGEQDIFGVAWDGRSWSQAAAEGRSWSGDDWRGRSWSSRAWTGSAWNGRSWSDYEWSDNTWDGRSWSGRSWSGRSWSGRSWSGRSWSGRSWSGRSWSSTEWR